MSMPSKVRVRFAPSPTGYLHVGGARTALFNYLYAKKMGGEFILRIEDTDEARSTFESLRMQVTDLAWLGFTWNEGPIADTLLKQNEYDEKGPNGPYRQSERKSIYKEHGERLLKSGQAYYCFCTDEELEEKKQAALKAGKPPHYDGKCRSLAMADAEKRKSAGEKCTVRFKVPAKDYKFHDHIRQEVSFPQGMVGDFIILRSDGMPVYNFCCTVDDALMKITHVLRAEEHLSNTLRQLMLYEAFGYTPPEFGHLSIILGGDRQKLSKRHGATSCHEYKEQGYLPEALNNFIALLGWSSPTGQEVMSVEEMASQFSLDRLNGAAAVFDEVKLKWMNATHLRALPTETLRQRLRQFIVESETIASADKAELNKILEQKDYAAKVLETFRSSMETFLDAVNLLKQLSDNHFTVSAEGQEVLKWQDTGKVVDVWKECLQSFPQDFLSTEDFVNIQTQVQAKAGVKGKQLFQPLRVAIIGTPHGTELKLLVPLLPKKSLLSRAQSLNV